MVTVVHQAKERRRSKNKRLVVLLSQDSSLRKGPEAELGMSGGQKWGGGTLEKKIYCGVVEICWGQR